MTYNVLFLCTANSARSIMAEAILNGLHLPHLQAFSAGSQPSGRINPFALERLAASGLDGISPRSKAWTEFTAPDAPPIHIIITVCDQAAGEVCPVWPGRPITAHWGIEDPAAEPGDDAAKRAAFFKAFTILSRRISLLASLPLAGFDQIALQSRLDEIGSQA
jgi:protein-tyrosine-phosphatase